MIRPFRGILPRTHPTALVDQSAQIIGDVEIGEESGIWMNAVVRGDVNYIRIGSRSSIQDLTMVHVQTGTHPTVVGDDVTVGHSALLHGCTVGNTCLIGMGAQLLNGATVGDRCIVAAGSLLTEGLVVPAGSLVMGRPAKVKRALTDADIEEIRLFARRYVAYRKDYME